MDKIFEEIRNERKRQNEKWGVQNLTPLEWLPILMEEIGEISKEVGDFQFEAKKRLLGNEFCEIDIRLKGGKMPKNYRNELVQTAAVLVQMLECYDRNLDT